MKRVIPFALSLLLLIGILLWFFVFREDPNDPPVQDPPPNPPTVPLRHPPRGFVPDWDSLNDYQESMSASELQSLIENVYAVGDVWKENISIEEEKATIQKSGEPFVLKLLPEGQPAPDSLRRYWKTGPLDQLHIAIDPGHIGGKYAGIEQRQFGRPEDKPVREGELTMLTAKRLKPLLEAMGAKVSLIRKSNAPVTRKRTTDFLKLYKEHNPEWPDALLKPYAQKRFYRRAEIVERARIINEKLKPDLVLCLHYNASSNSGDWANPSKPVLVDEKPFSSFIKWSLHRRRSS